jgi:hypothetical protein
LYRKNDGENYLTFKSSDDVICGARPQHLSNKEFLISKKEENNVLKTFWNEIFI